MEICKSSLCSGCALCAHICPKGAVEMEYDGEGFLRPAVSDDKCVDCGLCQRKCPVNKKESALPFNTYAAYAVNGEIRKSSSSGGIFYLLAKNILDRGGIVCGAGYGEKLRVVHKAAYTERALRELMGSKYVQSRTDAVYGQIDESLCEGKPVLFSGTPCQCSAVRNAFGNREGLYICDFICHGVPTPTIWEKYIEEEFPGADNASFRDKKRGWQEFSMRIDTKSGTYSGSQYKDPYLRMFLRNVNLRPSCYECSWKGENYASDITLADFWGISKICPEMNDDKGTSVVIIRSDRGDALYSSIIENTVSKEVDISFVAKINEAYGVSAMKPVEREAFFEDLKAGKSFEAIADTYAKPISGKEIVKMRIKIKAKNMLGKIYRVKSKLK